MRILVDITHPAHAHFFHYAIKRWLAEGDEVCITSRDKDLTLPLLDEFGFRHTPIGHARGGIVGLAWELVRRAWGIWRVCRQFKPHVAAAVAGTFMVHACATHNVPCLIFYDTEHARFSNLISYPFARSVITPRAYQGEIGAKHRRYNGYQELAYTHPDVFTPNPAVLEEEGLSPSEPFSIVRLVNWGASHDIDDFGVVNLREVVEVLSRYGRVILSSEISLPFDLRNLAIKGPRRNMLHLQAFANLFLGESATMASECAMLGTPAIFISTSRRGYIDEQQERYGMVFSFNDPRTAQSEALAQACILLEDLETSALWQAKRQVMLNELVNVTDVIMEVVKEYEKD